MSGYKYIKLTLNEKSPLFDARNEILEIAKAHDIYIAVKLYELDAYGLAAVAQEITNAIRARSVERSQHFAITEQLREAHKTYLQALEHDKNLSLKEEGLGAGESNRTETLSPVDKVLSIDTSDNQGNSRKAGASNCNETKSSAGKTLEATDIRRVCFTIDNNCNEARRILDKGKEIEGTEYDLLSYKTTNPGPVNLREDVTPLGGSTNLNLRYMNTAVCQGMYYQALIAFMTQQNVDRIIKKPILLIDEPWSNLEQADVDNALEKKIINSKQHKQLTEKLIRKPSVSLPEAKPNNVYTSNEKRTAELKRVTGL